jgi:hypothetical protein
MDLGHTSMGKLLDDCLAKEKFDKKNYTQNLFIHGEIVRNTNSKNKDILRTF